MNMIMAWLHRFDRQVSIKVKIISGIVLIMILAAGIYTVFSNYSNKYIEQIKDDEILTIYASVKTNTEVSLNRNVAKSVDGLTTAETMLTALKDGDGDSVKQLAMGSFFNFETTANLSFVAILDPSFKIMSLNAGDTMGEIPSELFSRREIAELAKKAQKSFTYETGWVLIKNQPFLVFVTTIIDEQSKVLAYAVAGMHRKVFFKDFSERIGKIALMANRECEITDDKHKDIIETLGQIKTNFQNKAELRSFIFSHKAKIMKAYLVNVADPAGNPVGRMIIADDFTELMKRQNLFSMISVGVIAGVLVIGMAIIFLLLTRVLRPLKSLDGSLRDFSTGKGDLTVQLEIVSKDEFGKVSGHFNAFVKNLRAMILNISNVTNSLAASSMELSSSAMNFAQNATTQTETIREVRDQMDSIANNSDTVLARAKSQADATGTISSFIIQIMESVQGILGRMKVYKEESLATAERIRAERITVERSLAGMKKMSESSTKIREIVSIINDISEQINLLSLNASIEAARAGEQGRGFAVVANEVSKLADQTASSTKEIETLIGEMVSEVVEEEEVITAMAASLQAVIGSIESIAETSRVIHEELNSHAGNADRVIKQTRELTSSLEEVTDSVEEQHVSIITANNKMKDLDETALVISAGAEELSSTSEEIASNAEQLKELIDEFKV